MVQAMNKRRITKSNELNDPDLTMWISEQSPNRLPAQRRAAAKSGVAVRERPAAGARSLERVVGRRTWLLDGICSDWNVDGVTVPKRHVAGGPIKDVLDVDGGSGGLFSAGLVDQLHPPEIPAVGHAAAGGQRIKDGGIGRERDARKFVDRSKDIDGDLRAFEKKRFVRGTDRAESECEKKCEDEFGFHGVAVGVWNCSRLTILR